MNSWPTKKLGDVADVFNGKTLSKDDYRNFGKLKTIKVKDFDEEKIHFNKDENGWVNKEVEEKLILRKGDTLIINAAHSSSHVAGKIGYCDEVPPIRSFLSGEIMILRAKRGVEPLLINSLIRSHSLKRKLKDLVIGIHLYPKDVVGLKIPLPPLKIQKQIVERLDKIAEARKLNNELIQKSDDLYRSLLHNELNVKFKNQNGKLQFKIQKLGEVCEINPSKKEIVNLPKNTDVSFLAMANVSENAEIINVQSRTLSKVRNGFTFFGNGDVLVAKITPCFENGKGAFVENMRNGIGFGSTEFHVLRSNQEILLNRFLYHLMSDKNFRDIGAKFMTGSAGQQRVSAQYLKNFKIPVPPLETQKQIVEKLSAAQEYKKQLLAQKSLLKELFDSVLYKSMKGKMD